MKLYIDDRVLALKPETSEKEEFAELKTFMTYQDMSLVFMGGSYDKRRIKNVCFLKKKDDWYLTGAGFLYEIVSFCRGKIKITELTDKREKFPHQAKTFSDEEIAKHFPFDYNDHQVRALKKILKSSLAIIKSSTSSGKTEMFIAYLKLTNLPTLILVNKVTLAIQTYDRIVKAGVNDVGLFHGQSKKNGNVVVSTIGSVKKIPDLQKFKVLIIDEVHRAQAGEFQEFLKATSYPIRLGFSATPEGNDKYKWATTRQYLGSIVEEIAVKELLENKVIVKPTIHMVPVQCPATLDWISAYEAGVVFNKTRNNKIKKLCAEYNKPTLILVRIIEHGEELERDIPNSFFVSGVHSAKERQEAIDKFTAGEIKVLISSNIFNEGISINAIRVLIIASGGKSHIETVQKLGRLLRLDKDKKEAVAIDFEDYGNKFTEKHSAIRKSIYQKLGFDISVI